jgi:hypothetical protein
MMDLAMALRSDGEKATDRRANWLVAVALLLAEIMPLPLVRLFAWGWPRRNEPAAAGSGGVMQVGGLPVDPVEMPVNQQAQSELIEPPVASDVFMGKKIEGLRPVSKNTDAAD